jgi:N-acetylglucosamine kinase-like BadF-type ATPase
MDLFEKKNNSIADVVLSLDSINKSSIENIAHQVSKAVMEGDEYAITAYIKAKALEEIASSIQEKIKSYAVEEAERVGGSKVLGCDIVVKSTPNKYNYDSSSEWCEITAHIEKLTERKKEIEKQMVLAMNYAELVDNDGVIVIPAIIEKAGYQTIQVKIPK